MNHENELRQLMARQSPPAGFADRVMERIAADNARRFSTDRRKLMRVAASFLLVASLSLAGHTIVEKQNEKREGEAAKEQLLLALRITAEKTSIAKSAVSRMSAD